MGSAHFTASRCRCASRSPCSAAAPCGSEACGMCGTSFLFFFQAEDGIRDTSVTGVQTCALPIWEEKEAEEKKANKKGPVKEETKLTGKQLWERGLAGKADFDEEYEETMPAAVDKIDRKSVV